MDRDLLGGLLDTWSGPVALAAFACHHCGTLPLTRAAVATISAYRNLVLDLGTRPEITSGYRCVYHNERVAGAAAASMHPLCHALDIATAGLDLADLPRRGKAAGFRVVELHPERGYAHLQTLSWP